MKALLGLLIILALPGCCTAQENSQADLQSRADRARGADCVRLGMQAARGAMEAADRFFGAGEVKAAHENVDVTVRYVRRAVECSLQSHRGEKSAEIELRELIRRTRDVEKTLDTEDRPHLKESVTELEKQRDKLLGGMFGAALTGAAEKKP
jgi:hypothetical protein